MTKNERDKVNSDDMILLHTSQTNKPGPFTYSPENAKQMRKRKEK
jgi:hypothetical protein